VDCGWRDSTGQNRTQHVEGKEGMLGGVVRSGPKHGLPAVVRNRRAGV
jgi:hypothetical protein